MSIIKDLAQDNLLHIALQGCRAVLERELGIKSVLFSLSNSVRQEALRRAGSEGNLSFPYSFITLTSLAAVKDRQNNFAVKKHGHKFNVPGERATAPKAYTYPITLGLDFHYIDADPMRLLSIAQALVLLSVTDGLTFQVNIGDMFTFVVGLEIPTETTINIQEPTDGALPGASDINVQFIMNTTVGFFRDVSAVNGPRPTIGVQVADHKFELDI